MMQTPPPTTTRLRVVVAEDDDAIRLSVAETLERSFGHKVVGQAVTGLEMVEVVLRTDPDVIVFDIHLPHLNGLDALRRIADNRPTAAVAITADRDPGLVRRAGQEHVQGFLVKPFELHQLGPAVETARASFEEMRRLAEENDRLQKSLESRKVIERAKGVLMRRYRWTEADAFRRLQRAAMNRRTTMAELARQVLDGKEIDL
jgi:two-component system, response regulator PdtaR